MGAGCFSATLDFLHAKDEWNSDHRNNTLFYIYAIRSATGFVSAGLTIVSAFSYSENLCKHLAKGYAKHQLRYRAYIRVGGWALRLASRVRLLVWVARMNWVGLALTGIEIGYLAYKDDDLQNWCEKSVFRKVKISKNWIGRTVTEENFGDGQIELEELESGAQSIGVGVHP